MTAPTVAGCARCGTILETRYRFCPECGLPVSGESVLSTDIPGLRHRVEAAATSRGSAPLRRYLLPAIAIAMSAFVIAIGLVLFNKPLLNRVLPPPPGTRPETGGLRTPPRWQPEWVAVPAGTFVLGDPDDRRTARIPYDFLISKFEISNDLWLDYLTTEHKRLDDIGLWDESFPRDIPDEWSTNAAGVPHLVPRKSRHPVRNVTPVAIAEFCAWVTRRLGEPGVELRLPTRLEWEYAARGKEGRIYPWGEGFLVPPSGTGGDGSLRKGIFNGPYAVDDTEVQDDDTSALGAVAMGVNVSEWVLVPDYDLRTSEDRAAPEVEVLDFPSIAGLRRFLEDHRIVVGRCGGNFSQSESEAVTRAKAWLCPTGDRHDALKQVGFRLVKTRVADAR